MTFKIDIKFVLFKLTTDSNVGYTGNQSDYVYRIKAKSVKVSRSVHRWSFEFL